ncbi:hypothetical protein [Pseudomonas sp.]|uniref:hypothetical protein n=1 Tax=Pseudomonas sp. TaxID=306 RepID=UPI002603B670|nr:hypothetical protein [Pseudomonas sp.]
MIHDSMVDGIAVNQSKDIQHLTNQVSLAQNRVAQHQVIVDAIQAKSNQFTALLFQAEHSQASALSNYKRGKDLVSGVDSLAKNYELAKEQGSRVATDISLLSKNMSSLINMLIFSVEVINKATQIVSKQKALNPLVPDTLVAFMSKSTSDANNAVALTLTALQSCYVAESTLLESHNIINLAADQVIVLQSKIKSGWNVSMGVPEAELSGVGADASANSGVAASLNLFYRNAVKSYKAALVNGDNVSQQLAHAQSQLAFATVKLSSLQAGLRAATAAAYAA